MAALGGHGIRDLNPAEPLQTACCETGFLGELGSGQLLRSPRNPSRKRARRELPGPGAYRVPILLHEMEALVVHGDDEREVRFLDHRVQAG